MKIPFSPKTLLINNSIYLHFYYANNDGRGSDNCSIIATTNKIRTGSEKSQIAAGCIAHDRTAAWRGNVNYSIRKIKDYMEIEVKTLTEAV